MSGPGGGGDQITIYMCLVDADTGVVSTAKTHFRRTRRVGAAGSAFKYAGSCKQLRTMAHGGDWLTCRVKCLHQLDYIVI